ncbi:hypothetical protein K432DRAFT_424190 [Lepidopterella palustris CBS 459.81]|uniref:Fungal N-terminal domain-containing protein n=1 Tax=Lepidopterella palustris CBS 459.81 TaxID=1314670 RepID=A0A8E2JH84_9PEZI|nr:hypothetical protein K432DRAFT_424190 [Lepidopterella palustris CBS 459.81]
MAEVFGIISGAVSLADVACRLCKDLYGFTCAVKNASAEIRRVRETIHQLEHILQDVKELASGYQKSDIREDHRETFNNINAALVTCRDDLQRLRGILGRQDSHTDTFVNRFGKRVKSVFNEKAIEKLSCQLDRHKTSLTTLLSIMGRRNELKAAANVATIARDISECKEDIGSIEIQLSDQTTRQIQLHSDLRKEVTKARETSTQHFFLTKTQIEEVHTNFKHELTQSASDSQRMIQTLAQNQGEVKSGLEQLNALLFRPDKLQISVLGNGLSATAVFDGSSTDAVIALSHVYPHLRTVLSHVASGSQVSVALEYAEWIETEFRGLLDDAVTARSQELRSGTNGEKEVGAQRTGESIRMRKHSSRALFKELSGKQRLKQSAYSLPCLPSPRSNRSVITSFRNITEIDLPTGKLVVIITRENFSNRPNNIATTARIIFVPNALFRISGVTATFIQMFSKEFKVSPIVSLFGVQPKDCPIFSYIKSRDLSGLRDALFERTATPNDRDENGNSLLAYAIENYDYNICTFLLEQGADPFDCNQNGDAALIQFVSKVPKTATGGSVSTKAIMEGIRLFISYCGVDVSKMLPYTRWSGGAEVAVASLAHTTLEEYLMNGVSVLEPIQLLLHHECDLEERNFHSNTVLLAAISLVGSKELVPVTRALLKAGANPLIISARGWGALHGLLWRLSACNHYDMTNSEFVAITDIVVQLLRNGCNPLLLDADGCSPSDMALSPTTWLIWCQALEKAGFNVASTIREDSMYKCGSHLEGEIEHRFLQPITVTNEPTRSFLQRHDSGIIPETINRENDLTEKCYRCHRSTDWEPRCPPFDVFGSYLMHLPGRPSIHRFSPDHSNGQACLDAFGKGPCVHTEHSDGPVREHALGLSWRKQLAYQLWRDGVLKEPRQSQTWATDLSRWELNPLTRWPQVKLLLSKEAKESMCPMVPR